MSRITYTNGTFNCKVACARCNHIKANGALCKNRVCYGIPTCWIHTKQKYSIQKRPSAVHGIGLFATKEIQANTWICPYVGEAITKSCLDRRYPGDTTATYTVSKGGRRCGRRYVDSACRRGIGSLANGKFRADGFSQSGGRHNAELKDRGGGVWLKSTKRILANREIFVFYGDGYRLDNDHTTKRSNVADNRPC